MNNIQSTLQKLNLREKIGQMFLIGFSGTSLSENTRDFIEKYNIGFTILFSKNIQTLSKTILLTNQIHRLAKVQPGIFADQEGGTVVQFKELTSTLVSPMALAQTKEPALSKMAGSIIAREMDLLGLDGIFSPVLDTNTQKDNPIIGIRSFSNNHQTVSEYAVPYFHGIKEHNIIACCKHFPGHGDTLSDSHQQLPVLNNSITNLQSCHLLPFYRLIKEGVDAILTSHILFKKINNKIATFDRYFLTEILRNQLNFKGLVFTDCLEMNAIKDNFTPREIVLNSINAGVDVLAVSQTFDFQKKLFNSFVSLVESGKISEDRVNQSVKRILELKNKYYGHQQRKQRITENTSHIRNKIHRKKEAEIAEKSIFVKKDTKNILPLNPKKKTLLIEWEKVKATMTLKDASPQFMMKTMIEKNFTSSKTHIVRLTNHLPEKIIKSCDNFEQIICATFSRTPEAKSLQVKAIQQLLKVRNDIIVIAMGNPFELEELEGASTLIATFGFRKCQLEALFNILFKR